VLTDLGDDRTEMLFEQRGSMPPEEYERATEGWSAPRIFTRVFCHPGDWSTRSASTSNFAIGHELSIALVALLVISLGVLTDTPGLSRARPVAMGGDLMGAIALLVYEKLGVRVLRKTWVNSDHLWASAFVFAGVLTLIS
jgi:hypothetical protein